MQNSDTLNELIRDSLHDEEEILWAGRPEGMKLLEAPYGTPIIIRWIICLILAAAALWYGLIYIPSSAGSGVNTNVVMVIWLAIVIAIALWPLMDVNKLKRKCAYFITDQRALTFVTGSSGKLKDMFYTAVSEITFDIIEGDRGNVYVGKKLKNSPQKARISAFTPPVDSEEEQRPLIFYSVINPEEIVSKFPPL